MCFAALEALKQRTLNSTYALAIQHRITCGKWMLFIPPANVRRIWDAVHGATVRGDLGSGSKVLVTPQGNHVICIYCDDFSDESDVRRVLFAIRKLLCLREPPSLSFKADILTHLGLYGNQERKFNMSLYHSLEDFPPHPSSSSSS